VLLYLADVRQNANVVTITSVSGGSLANGYIAQSAKYRTETDGAFWNRVRPLGRQLAQRGTIFPPSRRTALYLILLVLGSVLAGIGPWLLPIRQTRRVLAFVVGLLIVGYVASLRGHVAGAAFADALFAPNGKPTLLKDLRKRSGEDERTDHVVCATDLHAGENVYFSPYFVCSYRFGWGHPGDLPLHVAVQASCGLPPAFAPRWLRTAQLEFSDPHPSTSATSHMVLVDGGVYNNMADQWFLGMKGRRKRFLETETAGHWEPHPKAEQREPFLQPVDEIIVVNASAGLGWEKVPFWLRLPFVGEVLALIRDSSVLYDNGNSVRRELLFDAFKSGRLRGAMVHIARDPFHTPESYAHGKDELAERANEVLALLEPERTRLKQVASRSVAAKTTLSRMGTDLAADIVEHGYLLALANLHTLLGYGCDRVPDREDFVALVS